MEPDNGPVQTPKRKAEEAVPTKEGTKRAKPTYTPKATIRTTLARRPAANKMMTPEDLKASNKMMMEEMTASFKEITAKQSSQLTEKLSNDFKSAMGLLTTRVTSNETNIDQIRTAIKRLERASVDSEKTVSYTHLTLPTTPYV